MATPASPSPARLDSAPLETVITSPTRNEATHEEKASSPVRDSLVVHSDETADILSGAEEERAVIAAVTAAAKEDSLLVDESTSEEESVVEDIDESASEDEGAVEKTLSPRPTNGTDSPVTPHESQNLDTTPTGTTAAAAETLASSSTAYETATTTPTKPTTPATPPPRWKSFVAGMKKALPKLALVTVAAALLFQGYRTGYKSLATWFGKLLKVGK